MQEDAAGKKLFAQTTTQKKIVCLEKIFIPPLQKIMNGPSLTFHQVVYQSECKIRRLRYKYDDIFEIFRNFQDIWKFSRYLETKSPILGIFEIFVQDLGVCFSSFLAFRAVYSIECNLFQQFPNVPNENCIP